MPKFYYAPMCHLSGAAYRQLLRTYHPGIQFVTQMFSARAVIRNEHFRNELLRSFASDEADDTVVYLAFSTIEDLVEAIKILDHLPVRGFNLNFACPAGCAESREYGEFFDKELIRQCCISACEATEKPVSVKVRLPESGDYDKAFFEQFAQTGIVEIMCHARRGRKQNKKAAQDETYFDSLANAISVGIPLIANGGITTRQQGEDLCVKYGFHGYMIGMELARNPRLIPLTAYRSQFLTLLEYLDIYEQMLQRGVLPGQQIKELARHSVMLGGSVIRNEHATNVARIRETIQPYLYKE